MSSAHRRKLVLWIPVLGALVLLGEGLGAQKDMAPVNDSTNPYESIYNHFKLPSGRGWGSSSAVDIDKDGRSVWVAERCGANTCVDEKGEIQNLPVVLKFDESGKLVRSFGAGLLVFPHGMHVDADGNVWVTDGQDNVPRVVGAPAPPPVANPKATKGMQVFKFSPEGKLLMTLGKPGGANSPDYFFQPNDVTTNARGEILVSEGHSSAPGVLSRILVFSKDGSKVIKVIGRRGSGPGEFDQPHALAWDSKGRLFVADRGNNRIQILDGDGNYIDEWYQFSRPSGVYIDKNDMLYVADSESGGVNPAHGAWQRGIRIGSARDGKVIAFIPDPHPQRKTNSAEEGVAADSQGNIYSAQVGPMMIMKHRKK